MKILIRVAWVLGLGLMVWLLVRAGVTPILGLLSQAGWMLLWLIPLHALPLMLDALGWRALLRHYCRSLMLFAIAARLFTGCMNAIFDPGACSATSSISGIDATSNARRPFSARVLMTHGEGLALTA